MINSFLEGGIVPISLKRLSPPQEGITVLDNFLSLSHFPFGGKIVEKVVELQVQRAIEEADYQDTFQSGFRPGYGYAFR